MTSSSGGLPSRVWAHARKPVIALFLLGAVALIVHYAMSVDWPRVWQAIRSTPPSRLALAAAFAAGSHLVYACTDLFARGIIRGRVSKARSMAIAFVCYAFNLNLGAWVGSVGFRLRLYSRFGLSPAETGRIIGLSLITNWSGYLLLAGIVFSMRLLNLPESWKLGEVGLQIIGVALLVVVVVGLGVSALSALGREWQLFGRTLSLPPVRIMLGQLAVSSANWLLIAGIIWALLRPHFDYDVVLAVLLVAAVAGVIAHIPASIGVTEGVFIALLGHQMPHAEMLAALFVYRGLYYIVPLLVAVAGYAVLEAQAPGSSPGPKRPAVPAT